MTPAIIYVWFADNGNIRKWQSEPFPEGSPYVLSTLSHDHEGLVERLLTFAKAYPLDVFPEVESDERQWLAVTRPGLQDLIAASMGRHFAPFATEAASTITALEAENAALEARVAELEAGLERAVEIVRQHVPYVPPDGPTSSEHQAAYEAVGFAFQALERHAQSLLNKERKG